MKPTAIRKKIEEAALTLFVEKGINGATTKEIAREAGVAEGSIYRHFENKEDLAIQLYEAKNKLLVTHLHKGLTGQKNAEQKLEQFIFSFFQFGQKEPLAYTYIMASHPLIFPKIAKELEKPKDVLIPIYRQGLREKVFRKLDENLAAAMVIGMVIRVNFFLEYGLLKQYNVAMAKEVTTAATRVLMEV